MDFAMIDWVAGFANIVGLVAIVLLIGTVVRDRKGLRGFSLSGSFLIFLSSLGFEVIDVLLVSPINIVLGLLTLSFWFMAFAFTFQKWLLERKHCS
jgi:hypothetical protein